LLFLGVRLGRVVCDAFLKCNFIFDSHLSFLLLLNNLSRTFKDVITFIPVVIILIVPLTPVGHVLIFGAIQRFFPGFFPSCFTEQRQNLLQLYETTEFSEVTIKENLQVRNQDSFLFFNGYSLTMSNHNKRVFNCNYLSPLTLILRRD
jgi:hypothetical protein